MFGISPFAQAPFATLGSGNGFVFIVSEGITQADASSQVSQFAEAYTEPIRVDDVNGPTGILFLNIVEGLGVADTNTSTAALLADIAENINPTQNATINSSFTGSISESTSVADESVPYFALSQSVVEPITDVADNNEVHFEFVLAITEALNSVDANSINADFLTTIFENVILNDIKPVAGWFTIDDSQNVTWQTVANDQYLAWQNIGNTQNPNWVVVNNTQA